jgi:hypothetical protein
VKRYRVRSGSKDYNDPGPDLLRSRENAEHQLASVMGRRPEGWHTRVNPPGKKDDWTKWNGPQRKSEVLRRLDKWPGSAGAKFQVGRKPNKRKPSIDMVGEVLGQNVRHRNLGGTNPGAELVADLAREHFGGLNVAGYTCREYNGIPGSGWSDHAWGDAVDLWGPNNDKLTEWLHRMGMEQCLGGADQILGSKNGRVGSYYAPTYNRWSPGGPSSHLTHVHVSYRQHFGANPGCR